MVTDYEDPYSIASKRLENTAELKEKGILEEAEYQELRNLHLAEMKRLATVAVTESVTGGASPLETQHFPLPYGQMHSQIVDMILASFESARADSKQRLFRAMSEMAEKQALFPGDTQALSDLLEALFGPLPGLVVDDSNEGALQLLEVVKAVNEAAALIRYEEQRSPAAKAIADTAQQSSTRAVGDYDAERLKPNANTTSLFSFWSRTVLKDMEGAFEGGAAATATVSSFAAAFPVALPVAAAFGVVVGAGLRSGIALAEGR